MKILGKKKSTSFIEIQQVFMHVGKVLFLGEPSVDFFHHFIHSNHEGI